MVLVYDSFPQNLVVFVLSGLPALKRDLFSAGLSEEDYGHILALAAGFGGFGLFEK